MLQQHRDLRGQTLREIQILIVKGHAIGLVDDLDTAEHHVLQCKGHADHALGLKAGLLVHPSGPAGIGLAVLNDDGLAALNHLSGNALAGKQADRGKIRAVIDSLRADAPVLEPVIEPERAGFGMDRPHHHFQRDLHGILRALGIPDAACELVDGAFVVADLHGAP